MSRALAFVSIALVSIALASIASPARAQDEADARVLFERGTAAAHEGRFAEARIDLERSLGMSPRASTAFNLIVALRGMGELVAAADVCESLLAERHGAIEAAQRAEATEICTGIASGVAHLRIRVGGGSTIEIRVDGLSHGEASPGEVIALDVDPGAHVVTALAPGHTPVDRVVEIERGGSSEIELVGPPPIVAQSGPDLGLVIGLTAGGVALVVVIVIVAVVATEPGPIAGDFPVTATLLRF